MAESTSHESKADHKIRLMTESDVLQIIQLETQIFPDPWTRETFLEAMWEPDVQSLVVIKGDRIIGYMVTLWAEERIHILNIAVDKDYRKRGIATKLITGLEKSASKQGIRYVSLDVRVSNDVAIAFYTKHNFQTIGQRTQYYPNDEDALIMAKSIKENKS
jgi:ribosomal-protein-alanine N-acetyltransferase